MSLIDLKLGIYPVIDQNIILLQYTLKSFLMMGAVNKDSVLGASLILSVASLVLLFGVTWYFQTSLNLLQQQVEYDRELLVKLQEQVNVRRNLIITYLYLATCML